MLRVCVLQSDSSFRLGLWFCECWRIHRNEKTTTKKLLAFFLIRSITHSSSLNLHFTNTNFGKMESGPPLQTPTQPPIKRRAVSRIRQGMQQIDASLPAGEGVYEARFADSWKSKAFLRGCCLQCQAPSFSVLE